MGLSADSTYQLLLRTWIMDWFETKHATEPCQCLLIDRRYFLYATPNRSLTSSLLTDWANAPELQQRLADFHERLRIESAEIQTLKEPDANFKLRHFLKQ